MKPTILCLLALLACLTGCVPLDSLNPLFTDKDIVFDKTLLGDWISVNADKEETTVRFVTLMEQGKDNNYKDNGYSVTMFGKDQDGTCSSLEFNAHEIDLGGNKYLDLVLRSGDANDQVYPLQITQSKKGASIAPAFLRLGTASYMEFKSGPRVEARLRVAHWFAKITKNGDKLRLDWIDDEDFKKEVGAGKFQLTHLLLDNGKKRNDLWGGKQSMLITASTQELQKFIAEHGNDGELFTGHTEEMSKKPE
jgi:hypothetical protein